MKKLPDNFYDLDGYTQLKVCGCKVCREILKDQYNENYADIDVQLNTISIKET